MFDNLTEKLTQTFKKLTGLGRLSERNIEDATREVRISLLEADVNFKVVGEFINRVKERAVGKEVLTSITPGQQFVKIVKDELTTLMGEELTCLNLSEGSPFCLMLVGIHGSGKTTTAAKLARHLKDKGISSLLVPADLKRPAAIEQLSRLGQRIGVDVFGSSGKGDVIKECKKALKVAIDGAYKAVVFDTAGRMHINSELMKELMGLKKALNPHEILLVVDAMTGQDAVNLSKEFDDLLNLTGVVLTKLDGDARGGAALSVKAVVGKPIKFVGVGEGLDALEEFHPERMASRILGMGDVVTLVEKAQKVIDQKQAKELEKKILKNTFTLEDFKEQILMINKMGPLEGIMKMIPGIGKMMKGMGDLSHAEDEIKRTVAIINSMTPKERLQPEIIGGRRRKRISRGSGTAAGEVNRLLKSYFQIKKMMKKINKGGPHALEGLIGM